MDQTFKVGHTSFHDTAAPRTTNKLKAPWMENPTQYPSEYIAMADVISAQQSPNGSVQLNLGVGWTGEGVSSNAMMFGLPGLLSVPLGVGSISSNTFTPSATSATSAQVTAWVRNDQWVAFGYRDVRFQPSGLNPGDNAIFSLDGSTITYYRSNGIIVNQANGALGSSYVQITPTSVQIGNSTATAITPAPYSEQLLLVLTTFNTALTTALSGDALLPVLLPFTYTALMTLNTLLTTFIPLTTPGGPYPVATTITTAA